MCAETKTKICRIKHQLQNRIARNLGGIRRDYQHQSCSLTCQEQDKVTALPWFEVECPENDHKQSLTTRTWNSNFEQCTSPKWMRMVSIASKPRM